MSPQEAVEAPRFVTLHPMGLISSYRIANFRMLDIEGRFSEETRNALEKLGYALRFKYEWEYRGYMGAIRIDTETGWKETGADPRGWNTAVGW